MIQMRPVPAWNGYAVEWHAGDRVILSRRNVLFQATGIGGAPTRIGTVPVPPLRSVLATSRLVQRLLRQLCYNLIPLGDGRLFVTFANRIGILSPQGWQELPLPRPYRILRGGIGSSPAGALYFGEYRGNPERSAIQVCRFDPETDALDVVHVFPAGSITHVHSVRWDPYRNGFMCLTGDRGAECQILLARREFQEIEVIGSGTEDWRAVSIQPVPDGWIYATDAEFQQNVVCHVSATTGERRVIGPVEGPVYYSTTWGRDQLFGVTAERCDTMPVPEGILYRYADGALRPIVRFSKDIARSRLAWKLFMPGTLHFAAGPGDERSCFVSGVGLSGLDARVIVLERA